MGAAVDPVAKLQPLVWAPHAMSKDWILPTLIDFFFWNRLKGVCDRQERLPSHVTEEIGNWFIINKHTAWQHGKSWPVVKFQPIFKSTEQLRRFCRARPRHHQCSLRRHGVRSRRRINFFWPHNSSDSATSNWYSWARQCICDMTLHKRAQQVPTDRLLIASLPSRAEQKASLKPSCVPFPD